MHKFKPLIVLIVFFAIGCSSQDLSKQEYYKKGIEFLNGGNSDGSIIAFKKAIEMDQNFFEARYQLASAYLLSNKYESAERELRKALRLNPSLNEAHLALAKAYVNLGKNDSAIKEVDIFFNNYKDDPEALEYLLETVQYLPNEPTITYLLARSYFKKGVNTESKTQLKNAIILGKEPLFSTLEYAQRLLEETKGK